MFKQLLCLPAILFLFVTRSAAQPVDSGLNIYAERFSPEKLHLHFDRSVYSKDETLFFKAYLLEDHALSALSKNLYVDFYTDEGKLLEQTVTPLIQSTANGSFSIPQNYSGPSILVKAYTRWMLNFDTAFIFTRTISIHGITASETTKNKKKDSPLVTTTSIRVYPEGGFAIEGLNNHFAFSAADQNSDPVFIKGVIKSGDGRIVDSIQTVHDGMGAFSLLPEKGETYTIEWIDDKKSTGSTPVIIEKKAGANLQVKPGYKTAHIKVQRSANSGQQFKNMHLLVHRNHTLRYKLDLNLTEKPVIDFTIATDDLPAGIVQFTLFNADWSPVAERIIFVNNHNYSFQADVQVIKQDLSKKGKTELEVFVPDTLLANMSVAITDAGTDIAGDPTIFSDLLMDDEVKGKVNNPGYYFQVASADSLVLARNLDLVMLTHGHRRYDWEKIAKGELPVIQYPAETDYIGIRGTVSNKKLVRKNDLLVNVILEGKDSTRTAYILPVNKEGIFEKKNLFYYDSVQLYYSLDEKKTLVVQDYLHVNGNLLAKEDKDKFFAGWLRAKKRLVMEDSLPDTVTGKPGYNFFEEQERIRKLTSFKTLKEVIVSSRVKTKIQVLDNFYTSGVFAGDGGNYKVDVEGDVTARGYSNIYYYLQSKIPGLTVTNGGEEGPITVTWIKVFNLVGNAAAPSYFLDGIQVSLDAILQTPIANIAYVKAFRPPFVGSFLNGSAGTIAFYTKKGNNPVYKDMNGERLANTVLVGYTKFREYTQPDYDNGKTNNETDYRATLYWNPYVLTDKSNQYARISFYNNDISKKLLVIVEGVNLDGKLTRVVKLIE